VTRLSDQLKLGAITFIEGDIPIQFYLPWIILVNADTIAHVFTFVLAALPNETALEMPVTLQAGAIQPFPVKPFTNVSIDTPTNSCIAFYSKDPIGAGVLPSKAPGGGVLSEKLVWQPQGNPWYADLEFGGFAVGAPVSGVGINVISVTGTVGVVQVAIGFGTSPTLASAMADSNLAGGIYVAQIPAAGAVTFNYPMVAGLFYVLKTVNTGATSIQGNCWIQP